MPLVTAVTTAALRLATHLLVFGDGSPVMEGLRATGCPTPISAAVTTNLRDQTIASERRFSAHATIREQPHNFRARRGLRRELCLAFEKRRQLDSA